MRNLRVTVNNAADQTEARNIMISLGYLPKEITCISGGDLGFVVNAYNENGATYKEITLPELRDLVVLKRNDRNDRTHTDQDNWSWFISSNGTGYVFGAGNANGLHQWDELSLDMVDLKPIEKKEMKAKEYLKKIGSNEYMLMDGAGYSGQDNWIEIPEGSETFNFYDRKDNLFFLKGTGDNALFSNDINDWEWKEWGYIDFDGVVCLWSRHTHPEELPFIDDEPLQSLNDQYAEIEKVRQSAWQKQEGGSHYKNLKIQPMQYALENKLDYAQANVVKYVTRHKEKNGKEDLLKAIHNLELMIEFYYGDEK